MVKQRDEPVFKQRQPVLHPRQTAPIAHRLIKRIAGGIGTKPLAVTGAKALDAVFIEQRFACGEQQVRFHRLHRALRAGIKQTQRFQLVAKEIEPQPMAKPAGIQIKHRSAHRIFACIDHRIGARIALPLQQPDQAFAPDLHARREQPGRFADAKRGERALEQRVDCGNQQLWFIALLLQTLERKQSLRADRQGGRGAVKRQAIPRGKFDNLKLRRKECGGFADRAHRAFIGGDKHRAALAGLRAHCARQIGKHQRLRAACNGRESERASGRKDAVKIGHDAGAWRFVSARNVDVVQQPHLVHQRPGIGFGHYFCA